MSKKYLVLIAAIVLIAACSKDKPGTKPSIKIKKLNATELYDSLPEFQFLIDLEYTDKEGDLGNGSLTYIRNRLNTIGSPSNDIVDTINVSLPDFPRTSKGDIQLSITATFLNKDPNHNDTAIFKIFVTDLGGNTSDTISTPVLVQLEKP